MGLETWKNAPDGKILESDVVIAKNYLNKDEMTELNNLVSMYLDYAERQVKLGHIIFMEEWKEKLDVCLKEKIDIFIDDKEKTLIPLSESGVRCIKMMSHEEGPSKFETVSCWKEIKDLLSEK